MRQFENLKMRIVLILLVCLANTFLCSSQSKIYYNQDCEITIKELATFYSMAKIDTSKRIFVGRVLDYRMDSVLLGEADYDLNGEKNGPIRRFNSSGEIKLEGFYKKNKVKGDWTLGKANPDMSEFVKKNRLGFQIDTLEGCFAKKEAFAINKFIRKNDYPEIKSLLISERDRIMSEKQPTYRLGKDAYRVVEQRAEFPDGTKALNNFITAFLVYPQEAIDKKVKGQVNIEFTIMPDGSTTDFKITKGLGHGCDEEALRVMKLLPDWNPGYQRGKPVKSKMRIPITF